VTESSPAAIQLLRRDDSAPAGVVRPASRPVTGDDGSKVLACAGCLRPVTTGAARTAVAGAHEHTFANPAGFQFHIGCFARAIGCLAVGEPTMDWTWFSGYSWQVERCATCGDHLGWLFRAEAHLFHGLILDRLVEAEQ
jgi:hypothetical protein